MSAKKNSSENSNSLDKTESAPDSVAFIHNFLDEYGLDPYEFRIYTHMVRRTGGKEKGVCFASLKKTALICKMSVRKAQQALKVLLKANLLECTKRSGRTDEYRVIPSHQWAKKEELVKIRQNIANNGANNLLAAVKPQKEDEELIADL